MRLNHLSEAEKRVIYDKGTEPPGSGEYDKFKREGVYTCKQCGAYLYRSSDKFDAGCGWPSFDEAVLGAVTKIPDQDGMRTEIQCSRCNGHLGHVFRGENLTPKNTRHCVNSISMQFIPTDKIVKELEKAYLGGGCFWCTEAAFLQTKGVKAVMPGYAGGTTHKPTYEGVGEGKTGHAEVVEVTFDPTLISYEGLLKVFFGSHDPTTKNYQGSDFGTQYRSIILYETEEQKEVVETIISRLDQEQVFPKKIVTEAKKLNHFWEAEKDHHDYYAKNQEAGYCRVVISPKLAKLRQDLTEYME